MPSASAMRKQLAGGDNVEQRATRAETLIQLGELSSTREALWDERLYLAQRR